MTGAALPPPALTLSGVAQAFLGRDVISRISLEVAASEVLALVGPSGCGKSTLVHVAAGLVEPREGRIARGYARHGMVFQDPRLMPWAPADLGKYPVELSGGMRQRVAIARALVAAPDFVYFDEPFTALDVALRRRMQDLVIAAAAASRFAAFFVTHDLAEAARIAHRVAVMHPAGRGIEGARPIPGRPGARDEAEVFALTRAWQAEDPLFRHVHEVDERWIA